MNYPNELVEAVKSIADAINGEGGGGGGEMYNISLDVNGANELTVLFNYGESIEKIFDNEIDYKYELDVTSNMTLPIPKPEGVCGIYLGDGIIIQGNYETTTIEEEDWAIIKGDCTIKSSGGSPS